MMAACAPASAQVLSIEPDGHVVTQDRPALYLSLDLRPQAIVGGASAKIAPSPAATVAATIRTAAATQGLGADLVSSVAWRESRFDPAATSAKGARGVMQLMPGTARALGVDAADASANIAGGTTYLRRLVARYDGDIAKALAAYNAGPGAVDRWGGVPPYAETRAYVAAIMDRMATLALKGDAR